MVLILLDSNRSGIKPGALKIRRGHTALGGKAPAVVIDRMIGLADLEHDRGPERQRPEAVRLHDRNTWGARRDPRLTERGNPTPHRPAEQTFTVAESGGGETRSVVHAAGLP